MNELINSLIKRRRFRAVLCEIQIMYYINRTEYPLGVSLIAQHHFSSKTVYKNNVQQGECLTQSLQILT